MSTEDRKDAITVNVHTWYNICLYYLLLLHCLLIVGVTVTKVTPTNDTVVVTVIVTATQNNSTVCFATIITTYYVSEDIQERIISHNFIVDRYKYFIRWKQNRSDTVSKVTVE